MSKTKNRAIDLQLIKPVTPGSSGAKGKITLKQLFKEELANLQVPTYDPCCNEVPPDPGGSFTLEVENSQSINLSGEGTLVDPLVADLNISAEPGNAITLEPDGIFIPNVDPSADPTSKYVLTEVGDVFTFNGPKVTAINNKELVSVYKMPAGNLTNDFDNMVKNDAMAAATIAVVGGYDQVIVAGTTNASYIRFDKQITLNRGIIRLKVRVDAIGATAPLVGIRGLFPTGFGNFANTMYSGHINLLTGVVTESNMGVQTLTNGWSVAAAVGEIIDIEYRFDYLKGGMFTAYKANNTGGEISTALRVKTTITNSNSYHQWPAIVLADGTYSILDYEILAEDYKPKIMMIGDSMSCGQRIMYPDSIVGKLESKIPYRIGCIGTSATTLVGILAAQLWELRILKPEYVVICHYLESCQGNANPASGSYAVWSANFAKMVSTIKGMGMIPIFVYPETWAVIDPTGVNSAFYETYLNTNYASDMKVKVLTSESFYDSTAFHYNDVTNGIIADKIITLLDSVL